MKKHNAIKVVLVTMLVMMILTWVFPSAVFSSEFSDQGRIQMGLFDLFNYPLTTISYFGYISLFIAFVGGFYGVLNKIPGYRNLLDTLSKKCSKRGMLTISIIMVLLAVITSICGLQLGLIMFFPFIISLVLLMGYDKIVAALTVVGSTMVGVAGTTYGYSNVSVLTSYLSVELADNILVKVIILVVGLVLLILNTALYVKKGNTIKKVSEKSTKDSKDSIATIVEKEVKVEAVATEKKAAKSTTKGAKKSTTKGAKKSTTKKTTKSSKNNNKAAVKDGDVIIVKESLSDSADDELVPSSTNGNVRSWPVMVGFIILLVILILAFIPWNAAFGIDAMNNATQAVQEYQIFKFELFAKLLGNFNSFGDWMITDMFLPMAIVALLLSVIYKVKFQDVLEGFTEGAKKMLAPAVITLLIYTVLVITTYHPFQLTIYKAILTLTKDFNVFTSSLAAMLAGLFNSDPSYAFQSVVPYLTSIVTNTKVYSIVEIVYQSMYGFVMLLAPTSVVLMTTLSYLGVSYKQWLKSIWKLLVELLVILLIIFTILVLI